VILNIYSSTGFCDCGKKSVCYKIYQGSGDVVCAYCEQCRNRYEEHVHEDISEEQVNLLRIIES
jgi:hypothetical protein